MFRIDLATRKTRYNRSSNNLKLATSLFFLAFLLLRILGLFKSENDHMA